MTRPVSLMQLLQNSQHGVRAGDTWPSYPWGNRTTRPVCLSHLDSPLDKNWSKTTCITEQMNGSMEEI